MKTLTTHTSKGLLNPSSNSSITALSHSTTSSFVPFILIICKNNIISVLHTQMSKNKLPTNKRRTALLSDWIHILLFSFFENFCSNGCHITKFFGGLTFRPTNSSAWKQMNSSWDNYLCKI